MSKFDMINYDPVLGVSSWDYYLSFLTPESPAVVWMIWSYLSVLLIN